MRLYRQFQASFFFFTKRFFNHKKHQNAKQATFTLLKVCGLKKLLPFLFSVFVRAKSFRKKIINRLKIVLITSFYYTTSVYMLLVTRNSYKQSSK